MICRTPATEQGEHAVSVAHKPAGFVWGPINAEDLQRIPETNWVITSGMTGPGAPLGRLYGVCIDDLSCTEIFPYLVSAALDTDRFGEQDAPDFARIEPHGLDIVRRPDGTVELYLVNHGGRESVEVFEVVLDKARPALRWIGGAVLPGTAVGNDVAALPGDGFVVSTTGDPTGTREHDAMDWQSGAPTGGVLEWSPWHGWTKLPGTQINVANGIAVSPDGQWVFLGGWGLCEIRKVQRSGAEPEIYSVPAPIKVDNFTWSPDGMLISAGAYDTTSEEFIAGHFGGGPRLGLPTRVIRIDPDTLAVEVLVEYQKEAFGVGTTGLVVGDEIWVGAARDQGLARFRLANTIGE